MTKTITFVLAGLLIVVSATECRGQSAADTRMIFDYLQKMRENERTYAGSKIVKAVKLNSPTKEDIEREIAIRTKQRPAVLKSIENGIKQLGRYKRKTKEIRDQIAALKKQLADDTAVYPPRLFTEQLETGRMGMVCYAGDSHKLKMFQVKQVIDSQNMLVGWGDDRYWIQGLPTAGIVDDQWIRFGNAMKVVGTKRYRTVAGGSKSVHLLEPYDTSVVDKRLTPAPKPAAKPITRTFADTTGKFKIEATYLGYEGGNVKLKKADGTTISVPLSKLSDADRRWVSEQLRKKP